jgi:hypothetical protein
VETSKTLKKPSKKEPCSGTCAATLASAGGAGGGDGVPQLPPGLQHGWLLVERRHRVDALRKAIHALNSQRALVFMNFAPRLKVPALAWTPLLSLHQEPAAP